jgi:tripartite-type tricarboxylate transporter receptor subunit TctC
MGRAFLAGPKVPPERVALLRDAFDRMMKDSELLANAASRNLEIDAMSGTDLQDFVTGIGKFPTALTEKARRVLMG